MLVAVVVKRNRLLHPGPKFLGGILNPHTHHGKSYYLRRVTGSHNPLTLLLDTISVLEGRELQ
jgi:hypothetical protein